VLGEEGECAASGVGRGGLVERIGSRVAVETVLALGVSHDLGRTGAAFVASRNASTWSTGML